MSENKIPQSRSVLVEHSRPQRPSARDLKRLRFVVTLFITCPKVVRAALSQQQQFLVSETSNSQRRRSQCIVHAQPRQKYTMPRVSEQIYFSTKARREQTSLLGPKSLSLTTRVDFLEFGFSFRRLKCCLVHRVSDAINPHKTLKTSTKSDKMFPLFVSRWR